MSGSAAAARSARTGTASSTSANGVGGSYSESGAGACVDKFDTDCTAGTHQTFFYEKFKAIVFKNIVVIFWLIQSQSQ
ncbi:MAG: hypothetical protein KKD01_16955 [Proteobacteria bacterium]|nr:hypothetical protein [Pseudomonadota bacterium]MBU1417625.1 hypothetical protein [Pseudomonadota bacterium]MBU1456416.1 hypothetical protein [Pseudomonadota bacterium]